MTNTTEESEQLVIRYHTAVVHGLKKQLLSRKLKEQGVTDFVFLGVADDEECDDIDALLKLYCKGRKQTSSDYYNKNMETIRTKNQQYRINNAEQIRNTKATYYQNNAEQMKEDRKARYEREKTTDYYNERHKCPCGGCYTISNKAHHVKSKKHQRHIANAT